MLVAAGLMLSLGGGEYVEYRQSGKLFRVWPQVYADAGQVGIRLPHRRASVKPGVKEVFKPESIFIRDDGHVTVCDSARAVEAASSALPIPQALMDKLIEACKTYSVPVPLALAVMEQESGFDVNALNQSGCYGLMQLNPDYFPTGLSPAENIDHGVRYLGELLSTNSTVEAAVTAYFYGPSDRVESWYSAEVLARVERWKN